MARLDVKVIQKQSIFFWLDDEEADFLSACEDMPGVSRREAGKEALFSSLRIEPADSLKALSHCFDANRSKGIGIG